MGARLPGVRVTHQPALRQAWAPPDTLQGESSQAMSTLRTQSLDL